MPAKKKTTNEREAHEKDFDLFGKSSLGGFFKGLTDLIDIAAKAAEKGEALKGGGEIKGPGKDIKGVYGFSIKTLAGKPFLEHFGNIKETPQGPVVEEVREPIVDVFDEKKNIIVIAEAPGIEKKDIRVEVKEDALDIRAYGNQRKYHKEVKLPSRVKAETLEYTYKNGVIEIKLSKAA
ncbi:MAG: Hsp20/alpha crystallin family protein [Deltaproteobacteria bacterium]|nr:Hsp20/alpha crystallin family protein [Deltaproteobacteria bacterium]